jgi:SAM-dependent methyltransferase
MVLLESRSLKNKVCSALKEATFLRLTLTNPKRVVRKVDLKGRTSFLLAERKGAQEFHTHFSEADFIKWIETAPYKEAVLFTTAHDLYFSAGGKVSERAPSLAKTSLDHNRKKSHLTENPPYFAALGIKPDKAKQIEKFLREVKAMLPHLQGVKKIKVADFGCGKAYLTFALYDFLSQHFDVELTGIDLKAEVMASCQKLAQTLGFHGLHFKVGSIEDFPEKQLDMAVMLHACDTATDAAIARAVHLGAKVILAAPCCQHELYNQIKSTLLTPLLKHGILKERIAALVTDAARGALLEQMGFSVDIVEFIDAAHTPKNLLIRAYFTGKKQENEGYNAFKQALGLSPTLDKLLS